MLRLTAGDAVQAFDDAGATADAVVVASTPAGVTVRVAGVTPRPAGPPPFTVAAAVPKAARADWMVEKLSELGTAAWVPLAAGRSVALPEGGGKTGRWARLAAEAAKQSGRAGVMHIRPLTPVGDAVAAVRQAPGTSGVYFSTRPDATPVVTLLAAKPPSPLTLFIGPEGGWTDAETAAFDAAGFAAARLTDTVLRVETAAVAAAAVIACFGRRV